MTRDEAAIVTAHTGVLIGSFSRAHGYIEKILRRPVMTHELADKNTMDEIRAAAKKDFVSIVVED